MAAFHWRTSPPPAAPVTPGFGGAGGSGGAGGLGVGALPGLDGSNGTTGSPGSEGTANGPETYGNPAVETLQLVMTTPPPSSVTSGEAFSVVVSVEYSQGSIYTAFSGEVTLTVDSASGALLSVPFIAYASDGVASFSGLTINQPGTGDVLEATIGNSLAGTLTSVPADITVGASTGETGIVVANYDNGEIAGYSQSGEAVTDWLPLGPINPAAVAVSGSDLFVLDSGSEDVEEYTTSGATVNPALITGFSQPTAIAISGSDLFIADAGTGTVGEFTTSGATRERVAHHRAGLPSGHRYFGFRPLCSLTPRC